MKKILLFTLMLFFAHNAIKAQAPKHVNAKTFYDKIKAEEGIILDVRTPQEYSRGHIKGSTLINVYDKSFANKAMMLQKSKPIYVYCLTGSRSNAVVKFLSQNGFSNVYNLQRGIVEWNQLAYPVEQSSIVTKIESKAYTTADFNKLISTKKVVLVNFHAPWCAPCKKMAPTIEKIKTDFNGKATIEKVDVEANKALQTSYKVQSIPGLVLFKAGKEVWRYTGTISYDELAKTLNQYM